MTLEIIELFWRDFFNTFIEFLYAPLIFSEMLWILIPVLTALAIMKLYFSKYPREELTHYRALEYIIFLLFISFDLIRYVVINSISGIKVYLTAMFIFLWLIVAVFDFFHKLPKKILRQKTKLIVAFSSYIGIILVYSDILNFPTTIRLLSVTLSVFMLFLLILGIKNIFSYFEPRSYEEIEHFLKEVEEDIRKAVEEREKSLNYKKKEKTKRKKKTQPR